MTSPDGATPVKPLPSLAPGTPLVLPEEPRFPERRESVKSEFIHNGNLDRVTEDPLSRSVRSTVSTPTGTRTPTGRKTPSGAYSASASVRSSSETLRSVTQRLLMSDGDYIRSLIIRSFAPHIAVCASSDADELAKGKGCRNGVRDLLQPFGDNVQGKVVVRDSTGSSRGWDDFSVRFSKLESGGGGSWAQKLLPGLDTSQRFSGSTIDDIHKIKPATTFSPWEPRAAEEAVKLHLEMPDPEQEPPVPMVSAAQLGSFPSSPLYSLYLSRLLSAPALVPHETFSHPVTCVIAVSSQNPDPLEELRQLYTSTVQGEKRLPSWVNGDYLRYYLLIHDEDKDDINRSTAIFQQMKRHFGLNCHLLRLRSSQCLPSDDDSILILQSNWISSSEELANARNRGADDIDQSALYLVDSDAAAIRSFVRELVTQAVVPFMEHRIAAWNEQVASRRRGLSGRFMSLSKRWTVFSSGSSRASLAGLGNGSTGNYDSLQGFYRAESPEAILRKLGDFAFMLRDWKFAASTYDLLKNDYETDKAWMYSAGVNEMAALSILLFPQAMTSKSKLESIDKGLDTALYSYLTRCSAPYGALRCLILAFELLRCRKRADEAARWASKILELGLVGEIGEVLIDERIAACYASKESFGPIGMGLRRRKAAMWNVFAADVWLKLERPQQARRCMIEVDATYDLIAQTKGTNEPLGFKEMQSYLEQLRRIAYTDALDGSLLGETSLKAHGEDETESAEVLDTRPRRRSLIGGAFSGFTPADANPPLGGAAGTGYNFE